MGPTVKPLLKEKTKAKTTNQTTKQPQNYSKNRKYFLKGTNKIYHNLDLRSMLDEDRNQTACCINQNGILEDNCRNRKREQQLWTSGDGQTAIPTWGSLLGIWQEFDIGLGQESRPNMNTAQECVLCILMG